MSGESNLDKLIKNIKPQMQEGQYVFCTVDESAQVPFSEILCMFREKQGITLVLLKEKAEILGLEYDFIASWITLTVHSSLEAIGLTARVADALTKEGISCNAIAAYYHDHLFVPYRQADKAMSVLRKL